MLRHLIGEDIDINWLPDSDLWAVKMDHSQLDQIFANQCVNARDAIDEIGKVTIETQNAICNEAYCAHHTFFTPGGHVMLARSDNGCGIVKQNEGFVDIYSEFGSGTTARVYLSRYLGEIEEIEEELVENIPLARNETVLVVEDDLSILKLAQ